jgi:hypothetical protein
MAAMLDDITKEASEKSFVNILQYGGDDVTCNRRIVRKHSRDTETAAPHANFSVIFVFRILTATKKAYRVAIQHFTDTQITTACVVFTEMLGVDSTGLRVDVQACNRVLSHGKRESLQGTDGRNGKTLKDKIGILTNQVIPIRGAKCIVRQNRNFSKSEFVRQQ